MNERNTSLYKYIPHFILEKGPQFVVSWEIDGNIYSERGLLLRISSSGSQGVPTFASPCKLVRDDLIGCVSHARLRFSALYLNLTVVLITWSPSGYTPVVPDCPDVQSYPCLLITAWQRVKSHEDTRNEPKIHVICYVTFTSLTILIFFLFSSKFIHSKQISLDIMYQQTLQNQNTGIKNI